VGSVGEKPVSQEGGREVSIVQGSRHNNHWEEEKEERESWKKQRCFDNRVGQRPTLPKDFGKEKAMGPSQGPTVMPGKDLVTGASRGGAKWNRGKNHGNIENYRKKTVKEEKGRDTKLIPRKGTSVWGNRNGITQRE